MFASNPRVGALTAVLAVVFAGSGWLLEGFEPTRLPGELLMVGANTLPLLAIRRNPLAVVALCSIAYPAWVELGYPIHELQSLPTVVAMYALGAWDRPLRVRAAGLAAPVWMVSGGTLLWGGDLLELTFVGVFFVAVWALGVLIADRRARAATLEARTLELEQARQQLTERAVADERARIARELHDVVAHAMSVITVQAGVGAHIVGQRPAQAAQSLEVIEHTGREALAEMRRMLTVLRDDAPDAPVPEPQPTLADLPTLVDSAQRAGIHVALVTQGAARRLPVGLELAVYRVIQEALTNVVKHAPSSRATVTTTYAPAHLDVEVSNGLPAGRRTEPPVHGHGLRGMSERVALYAGSLTTSTDERSFTVSARFPIEETAGA
ncbi:sensor histidine kinase [Egibacter rhizosphaerae]|uniref:histidine kinase n=1 Tax=Egibacter rhizosphaerae TaxID=1670831 RepID=A0A411YFF4_9ACTN|nr:sensor histidine kinase [Egibacter rhizosphaerae]QBI19960.1 sensor histidine kinase [Egibacter rhizosphaerae]